MIEKILVADDDPLMLRFITETLKRQGIEVSSAKDGQEAIQLLERESFDLILSDVKMPAKSGVDVLLAAKKNAPPLFISFDDGPWKHRSSSRSDPTWSV